MTKAVIEEIKGVILSSKSVILAAHVDPDGDTLGSMIALALILKKLGIECVMYSTDGVPNSYKFLPHAGEIVNKVPNEKFDLLITVDSSDISRIGKEKIHAKKIINIDHHPDNTNFGDINYVELISSVAEQVFHLAQAFEVELDQETAFSLYISIITDTGNFRYSNTLPSTFEIAKVLVEKGADPQTAAIAVYDNRRIEGLRILAKTLLNAETLENGKIIYSVISSEMIADTKARGEDLVGIIDHMRSVKTAEIAILFREESKGVFKLNFRSKGKINVSNIARACGGGGHVQASGCTMKGELEEVKRTVLDLVLKEFKSCEKCTPFKK